MTWTSSNELINWINTFQHLNSGKYICPSFFKPHHLVTLGLALKKAGCTDLGMSDENLKTYATRMKLWDAIGITPTKIINHYSAEGRFLPICAFKNDGIDNCHLDRNINNLVRQLMGVIKKNTLEYKNSLSNCLLEIVNNFYDHSNIENDLPCLIAAQSWPRSGLIQIAVADAGIGIRESLNNNSELLDMLKEYNACELASLYGITSKPNNEHSGYGLTLAKDLMTQAKGSYFLISGNELFSSTQIKKETLNTDFNWQGTLLVLEWRIGSQLNSGIVYQNWPLPEGFHEDDFFAI